MKNPGVAITGSEMTINEIDRDAFKWVSRFDWLKKGCCRGSSLFIVTEEAKWEQPANFIMGDSVRIVECMEKDGVSTSM